MMVLAHIQGVPIEEFLIAWLGGGAGVLTALAAAIGMRAATCLPKK